MTNESQVEQAAKFAQATCACGCGGNPAVCDVAHFATFAGRLPANHDNCASMEALQEAMDALQSIYNLTRANYPCDATDWDNFRDAANLVSRANEIAREALGIEKNQ
jgi:hypothetical protein